MGAVLAASLCSRPQLAGCSAKKVPHRIHSPSKHVSKHYNNEIMHNHPPPLSTGSRVDRKPRLGNVHPVSLPPLVAQLHSGRICDALFNAVGAHRDQKIQNMNIN